MAYSGFWDGEDAVRAEMFLQESQYNAYFKDGPVPWYDGVAGTYRCKGLEPSTFPKRDRRTPGEVPFKAPSADSLIAMEAFAYAYSKKHVNGLPEYLVEVSMSVKVFMYHLTEAKLVC